MNERIHIGLNEFEEINCFPINDRLKEGISSRTFKFFNDKSPAYLKDVFESAGHPNTNARASIFKINQPLLKVNYGPETLFNVAPNIWNNLTDTSKATKGLNTYIYKVKK